MNAPAPHPDSHPDLDMGSAVTLIDVTMTDPCPLPMTVVLSSDSENPGRIMLSFFDGEGGKPPVWFLPREMLADALTAPVDDGNILLHREDPDTLVVVQRLPDPVREEYPGGRIRFEFPAGEIRAFLGQPRAPVPAGAGTVTQDAEDAGLDLLFHLRPE